MGSGPGAFFPETGQVCVLLRGVAGQDEVDAEALASEIVVIAGSLCAEDSGRDNEDQYGGETQDEGMFSHLPV